MLLLDKRSGVGWVSDRGVGPGLHPAGRRVHGAEAWRARPAGHRTQPTQLHRPRHTLAALRRYTLPPLRLKAYFKKLR